MLTDFKAQAEALIKLANNRDGLLTCALRSSIVFGPGDQVRICKGLTISSSHCCVFASTFIILLYLVVFLELDAFLVFLFWRNDCLSF